MKKLLTFFLTALLAFAVGWADEVTYTFSSRSWEASPENWTGTANGNQFNTTGTPSGVQVTTGNGSGATVTCPQSYNNISSIVVNYSSSSKGVGNIAVYVGDTPVGTQNISKSQTKVNLTYSVSNLSGVVKFVPTVTANSMGINSVTITYTPGGSSSHKYYHRVTSADELVDGKKYLIVYEQGNKFLGGIAQNITNGYYGIAVNGPTINGNVVDIEGYSDIKELTLGVESNNAYTLNNGDGYLCYYSGDGSSPLNTQSSVQNYSRWRMVAKGSGFVVRNYTATSRYIQYDASVPAFATYSIANNSKEDAYLYVEGEADVLTAAATPTFSPDNGTEFYGSQDVTITSATTGATIYYTTDGSDPTSSSASIASGETVTLTSSCTLKAIAMALGYNPSEVATGNFTKETLPMPTFSPVGGTYDIGTTVTVNINAVNGAAIYYTLDGSTPVANRAAYSGPITITENTTLKAIAVLNGETSEVATAEYTFAAPSPTCDATIVFKNHTNSSTDISNKVADYVESGSDYVNSIAGTKVYTTTNQGVRIGTGNATGQLTFNLNTQVADWKVKKVIVNAASYGDNGVSLNVSTNTNTTGFTTELSSDATSLSDYEFTGFDGSNVTSVTVATTSKRAYIKSITIYYECAPVARLTAEPNPLNINDDNSANGKTGTFSVNGSNLGTDNVGVTVNGSHSANFTTSPGYFTHDGTLTDQQASVTYTGHALSATGLIDVANNQTSTSVNVNYLYTGPIYVVGNVNDKNWQTVDGVAMTRDEATGTYSVMVNAYNDGNGYAYLYFTKSLSASSYDALGDNRFGPVSNGNWELNNEYEDHRGEYCDIDTMAQLHTIQMTPGTYTITINPATNEFMITPYVITVTISPEDGSTFTGSTISGTITDSPTGTIEWSTDGENWQQYDGGFTATAANVGDQVTVYARSTSNGVTSEVVTATYTRVAAPAPAAPTFSRGSGDVRKGTVITITAPEGTTLYVDGQQVTSPYDVTINRSTTISAYCVNDEGTQSEIVTNTYKISAVCEAVVEFMDNNSDASTDISWNSISGSNSYFESGEEFLLNATGINKVFKGKTGLKFSSNTTDGHITFNLATNIEWNVKQIILNAAPLGTSSTFTVTTSEGESKTTSSITSEVSNYTLDFSGSPISSITIEAFGRVYLKGFTLVYNCGAVVEAPVITPATGTYYENQTVTITAQDGATIYYTTNGSEPTTSSAVYNGSFTAAYNAGSTTTIKAIAVDEEDNVSEVATATYTWATPSVTIHPDSRNTAATFINVTLTSEPADGTIYYTTDGSTPTATDGTPYNGGFTVNIPNDGDAVTVKAITVAGDLTSPVATATYTHVAEALDVHAPFFSPLQNNTYYGDQTLQIASTTPNADIYYEIVEVTGTTHPDASTVEEPTHMSIYYDGTPIEMTMGHSYYVKAIAYVGNYVSSVSEGWYVIDDPANIEWSSASQASYYVENCAEFNQLSAENDGVKFIFANPVQVVYHSTYVNNGTSAEFCYVRDNTDYACVYFGKADTHNYHIFKMGDWIPGGTIEGELDIYEHNYHNQLGTSTHTINATLWPSEAMGWSEIIPETTTCADIASGVPTAGQNKWGHYVHVRYSTMSNVHDETGYQSSGNYDMKHTGYINDQSQSQLSYYDKFYLWSAGTCRYNGTQYTINHLGDYTQEFFDEKQNAGATFDVYGVVDWYGTKSGSTLNGTFQICPIDFLWIFKPEISLQSGTYLTTQTVNITAEHPEWAAEGVVIYYKTDDMEEWAIYTGPLTVNSDTHLQAYAEVPAHKSGTYGGANYNDYVRSEVVEATYNFDSVNDPVIDPESQTKEVGESVDVYVMDTNDNASVVTVYTTDGTRPSASNGTVLNEITQFTLTTTTTVSAVSYLVVAEGDTIWSNVVTRTYEFIEDNGKTYNLLTSNPVVGNVYVIVNKAASVGLSTTQNVTNRAGVGVKFTDDATKAVVKGNTSLAEFMLESATAGRYYFRQVGTQNYLTITTDEYANLMTGDAGTDAEASVTVGSNNSDVDKSYPATVTFTYEGNSRYLRYYAGGRFFTTYSDATNQSDIFLYGIEAPVVLDPSIAPNSQFVGEESLTVTVTPASENPEGAVTYYTTDGSDPRTSTTRQLWTSENGVFDVNTTTTVKAVSGIEFADTYVWSNVVSETYTFIEPTTLAWIEEHGVVTTDYVVADELIGTWAVDNPEAGKRFLWAKDQGNTSIDKRPAKTAGQRDYVKDILKYPRVLDGEAQANWDESNWVILDFSNISADPFEFVGHKITAKSVIGKYSDNKNYRIVLEQAPDLVNNEPLHMDVPEYEGYNGPFPESKLGTKYDLAYNTFVPANFMTENHNLLENGKVVGGFVADETALPGLAGDSLYFVNPKIQEVAHIWAVWNGVDEAGDIFTVYATEHQEKENINAWHLNGTFRVDWTYNCTGVDPVNSAVHVYDRPEGLVPNMAYEFHAVVMKPAGNSTRLAVAPQGTAEPGTPSPSYMVYPLDMQDGGTPTAVIELNAMKTVVGVTYYNLMGQESSKPFEGINIVVTRYSDGSMMTRKVLR